MNKIIITNETELPKKSSLNVGYSYVATLKVFVEEEDASDSINPGWTYYFYQNQWEVKSKSSNNKDPKEQVLSYFGSGGGKKNKANKLMLKAMHNSSKDIEIFVNETYVKTDHSPFYESQLTTECRQKNKKNCWNKNNASGGHHSYKVNMQSIIAYEKLSPLLMEILDYLEALKPGLTPEELNNHEKIFNSIFSIGQISQSKVKELIENNAYVQCRELKEGNPAQIALYEENMKKLISWLLWKGYVVTLMDEKGNIFKILDGNESCRSMIKVPNMDFLKTVEIPYSWWKDCEETELESLGQECNKYGDDRKDYVSIGDAERQIHNIIVDHDLFTKLKSDGSGRNPVMDHPVFNRLDKLNMGSEELKIAKNRVEKFFLDKQLKERKRLEGSFDFSEGALKPEVDGNGNLLPNKNLEAFIEQRKEIWEKYNGKYDESNTVQISAESNIFASITKKYEVFFNAWMKDNKPIPTDVLFLLTFDLEKKHDNFENTKKGSKEYMELYRSIKIGKMQSVEVHTLDPSAKRNAK